MKTAQQLYAAEVEHDRTEMLGHSREYYEGLLLGLKSRLEGVLGVCGYDRGSLSCDAFYFGIERARQIVFGERAR